MGIVFSCCAGQALSCCTSVCCSCFGKLNLTGSIATRITYATIFLLNSGLAAIFSHPYIFKKLEDISYGYLKINCGTGDCYGPISVHRVCFALTLLHFILAGLVFNVNDTHNPRAKIQNQYWSGKFLAWVGFLVISFFIPHTFFVYWSKYVATLGAGVFMLIQLLLLIDFTHSWAERCLENWENDNNDKWKWILVGSTLSVFCISIVMIGLEYGFFSGHGCTLNQTIISVNLVLAFIAVFLSIHPRVQDVNPKSGLTQAGIMVLYGTYLIASAMINEPTGDNDGEIAKHCNPMDKTAGGKSINFAIGAIFTIIAIVYSTSRAATQSSTILASSPEYSSLPLSDPSSRSNAIQAAVNSGSISQSEANEDDGGRIVDDEETGVAYNYTFFHLVFAIASMYAAMLLTNWGDFDIDDSAVYIGRSMYALWVKVGTSWISYGLFFWTLVAPILLPDREWL